MKKAFFLAFLFLYFFFPAFGQKDFAREEIRLLCSPEFHGRGYVKEGHRKAADYLAKRFEAYDLRTFPEKTYRQEFPVDVNTFPSTLWVTLNGDTLAPGEDYIVDPASGGGRGSYEPYVIDTGNFRDQTTYATVLGEGFAEGHIVVLDPEGLTHKDSLRQFLSLQHALAKKAPVLVVQPNKLTWGGSTKAFPHPVLMVKEEVYRGKEGKAVSFSIGQEFKEGLITQNVIGYIKGTRTPDEYLVFSAHYDHLGRMGKNTYIPGANDNASGTAMLLALARHFSEHPPERSMVFMAFGAEEIGLLGSRYYTEHPWFPLDNIRFLLNLDLLGGGSEGATLVNGKVHEETFSLIKKINEEHNYLPGIKARGAAANSDHHWFSEKGVPAFFLYLRGGPSAYHDIHDKADNLPLSHFNETFQLLVDLAEALP